MKTVRRILPLFAALALAAGQERVVESVVPALAYGPACSSTVELQNLSDRPVVVDVEPHRASGALVAIAGHPEITIRLTPRERSTYKLEIEEETESAWVKVRERVPSPGLSPVVAVSGATAFEVQIPPFGAREFPVARSGSSHFSLKTQGAAIVLEMLRPLDLSVKMYKVDSTIQFGSEVPG